MIHQRLSCGLAHLIQHPGHAVLSFQQAPTLLPFHRTSRPFPRPAAPVLASLGAPTHAARGHPNTPPPPPGRLRTPPARPSSQPLCPPCPQPLQIHTPLIPRPNRCSHTCQHTVPNPRAPHVQSQHLFAPQPSPLTSRQRQPPTPRALGPSRGAIDGSNMELRSPRPPAPLIGRPPLPLLLPGGARRHWRKMGLASPADAARARHVKGERTCQCFGRGAGPVCPCVGFGAEAFV